MNDTKPTLLSLRRGTGLTTEQLAQLAGVTLGKTYTVEIGGFVDPAIAKRVVAAFATLSGTPCTLNDICINNTAALGSAGHQPARQKESWWHYEH